MAIQGGMLALVRHGHSSHNGNATDLRNLPRFQGHWKPHLTDLGREQAHRVATFMIAHEPDREIVVVSSSFKRARQTTEIIAEKLYKEGRIIRHVIEDERLQERDVGRELDGQRIPLELSEREIDALVISKGGEPIRRVWERISNFIETLKGGAIVYDGALVVAVTHAFPIKAAAGIALGVPEQDAFQNLNFDNGSITTAEFSRGRFELLAANMTAHLDNGNALAPFTHSTVAAQNGIAAKLKE